MMQGVFFLLIIINLVRSPVEKWFEGEADQAIIFHTKE